MKWQSTSEIESPPFLESSRGSRRFWNGIGLAGLVSLFVLLVVPLSIPRIFGEPRHDEEAGIISNARQLGLALYEFKSEYGKYPDVDTISKVKTNSDTDLHLGTKTSNDIFRQLIASGIVQSESLFHIKTPEKRNPDNVIEGSRALEKGEVGLAYVSGLTMEGNPSRPFIVGPLVPGTDLFDPGPLDGKALIFTMDNKFSLADIGKDGRVMVDGRNVLDPEHPVWGGEKWTLLLPE